MTETTTTGPRPPRKRGKFSGSGAAASGVTATDTAANQDAETEDPPPVERLPVTQGTPENPPEPAADGPTPPTEGKDPKAAGAAPQGRVEQAPEGTSPNTTGPDPEGKTDGGDDAGSVEILAPPAVVRLPDFARIHARSATTMSPAEMALYTRALEVEFMQVTSSFRAMMDRQQRLTEQVRLARAAGFPEHVLDQLATKHNWEVPETRD